MGKATIYLNIAEVLGVITILIAILAILFGPILYQANKFDNQISSNYTYFNSLESDPSVLDMIGKVVNSTPLIRPVKKGILGGYTDSVVGSILYLDNGEVIRVGLKFDIKITGASVRKDVYEGKNVYCLNKNSKTLCGFERQLNTM